MAKKKTVTVYDIDRLTETARCNLILGRMEVYDVLSSHLNHKARRTAYQYRLIGRSIVFRYKGRNKILVYN